MLRRASAFLLAVTLGTAAGAMGSAGAATAGGWAATVLDPAGPIEPGKAHRVSFWVLQHGTHPYNWAQPASMGTVGLTLTGERGARVSFIGEALPEPAHYVTTVTVPIAGQWKVTAVQGVFAGYHVGALTVPGTFQQLGVPAAPSPQDLQKYWPSGAQPPVLTVDRNREPFVEDDALTNAIAGPAPVNAPPGGNDTGSGTVPADRTFPRTWILAGGLVVLLLVALALGGRRWWVRRGVRAT